VDDDRTPTQENIGLLLALASGRAVAAAGEVLRPRGLNARSYSLLEQLVLADGPSQRELADALRLDPSQIVALVDLLEERGLARRRPHSADRRQKLVAVTPAGRRLYAQVRVDVEYSLDDVLADLSPDERELLRSLLHRIVRPTAVALEDAG
jgi:DNA-binding MarR family transcriptional regulator